MPDIPKVLIVDDEPRMRKSLEKLLSNQSYKVETSNNAEEAIEVLDRHVFDLVLLDIYMPGENGFKIMDHIINQSVDTLVIIMTGLASVDSAIKAMRKGAYDYLKKPFEPEKLLATVKNALDHIRLKRASRQAEETVRESEERYRSLFENKHTAMLIIDPESADIVDANPGAISFYGWSHEELTSKKIANINTLTEDQVFQEMERAKTEQRQHFYFQHRLASGEIRDVEVYSGPIKLHGKELLYSIIHDITFRKKVEEALRESEERYRTVLEANPDPVVVYDIEGNVIYFNPAFTRVFGWTLKERIGKKMDVFVPDEAWPETKAMIDSVLAGESFSSVETRRITKEGKVLPVSISSAVYRDQENNPMGSVVNLRDISEQKMLQKQLQQSKRMESLGTLAGGIAHDFNNLLMGIQGRNSLMLMDATPSHPYFEHLKGIEDYIQSATDLTKQLLGFAMGGKYEVKPTDLNGLVKNQSLMFGRTHKEISIHEKFEENLWIVEIDQGQIKQVLLNLYVNAWQAMPGGGNIYVQTENVTVDKNYMKPFAVKLGNYVKISVIDTGIGMDEDTQQRIFDPFFTTKEKGRGTGLGLASAYGIIKNHGGFINIYSEIGQGTTFNIYLPTSDKKAIEEAELSKDVLKGSETVLLVDDEDIITTVGRSMLEQLGYKTMIVNSGKDAIEIYKKMGKQIAIVILDMIMPEMSGGNTYDKLKAVDPEVKVLLSSGYSVNGQATEILERGCNGFIQKPFNIRSLSHKLRVILDKD
jgi:PAS domain S-box-containing protein